MKTLNKILGIGFLALTSLAGCTKSYRIDDKVVLYNEGDVNPMIVLSDSNKITYQTEHKDIFNRTTGKDISKVKIAKARKNQNFSGRTIRYKTFAKIFSIYNPKDSAVIKKEKNNFDYYLSKIDSIEKSK